MSLFVGNGILSFSLIWTFRVAQAFFMDFETVLAWVISSHTIHENILIVDRVFIVSINHVVKLMRGIFLKLRDLLQWWWVGVKDHFLLIWFAFMNRSQFIARQWSISLMRIKYHFPDQRLSFWWVEESFLGIFHGFWVHLCARIRNLNFVYSFRNTLLL